MKELIKVAAIIALTLTAGLVFYTANERHKKQTLHSIIVPPGQRVNLILPDGTNVWLNARTTFRYPGVFTGSKREVELDGEAWFEVKHNKKNPFIVHTNTCEIEVLGTTFNVEDYSGSDDFRTALMEGSVKISGDREQSLILLPDQMASIRNGVLTAEKISDYDYYSWREGLLCFKDLDFMQLMRRFEKSYGVQIEVMNEEVNRYGFSGKFRISDGIDNALRVLQKDVPYTIGKNEDNSVIYIK